MRNSYMTMRDLQGIGALSATPSDDEKAIDIAAQKEINKAVAGTRIYSGSLDGYADLRKSDMPQDVYDAIKAAAAGNILTTDERAGLKQWADQYFAKYGFAATSAEWAKQNLPGLLQMFAPQYLPKKDTGKAATTEDILADQKAQADAQKRKMINIAVVAGGGALVVGLIVWAVGAAGRGRRR